MANKIDKILSVNVAGIYQNVDINFKKIRAYQHIYPYCQKACDVSGLMHEWYFNLMHNGFNNCLSSMIEDTVYVAYGQHVAEYNDELKSLDPDQQAKLSIDLDKTWNMFNKHFSKNLKNAMFKSEEAYCQETYAENFTRQKLLETFEQNQKFIKEIPDRISCFFEDLTKNNTDVGVFNLINKLILVPCQKIHQSELQNFKNKNIINVYQASAEVKLEHADSVDNHIQNKDNSFNFSSLFDSVVNSEEYLLNFNFNNLYNQLYLNNPYRASVHQAYFNEFITNFWNEHETDTSKYETVAEDFLDLNVEFMEKINEGNEFWNVLSTAMHNSLNEHKSDAMSEEYTNKIEQFLQHKQTAIENKNLKGIFSDGFFYCYLMRFTDAVLRDKKEVSQNALKWLKKKKRYLMNFEKQEELQKIKNYKIFEIASKTKDNEKLWYDVFDYKDEPDKYGTYEKLVSNSGNITNVDKSWIENRSNDHLTGQKDNETYNVLNVSFQASVLPDISFVCLDRRVVFDCQTIFKPNISVQNNINDYYNIDDFYEYYLSAVQTWRNNEKATDDMSHLSTDALSINHSIAIELYSNVKKLPSFLNLNVEKFCNSFKASNRIRTALKNVSEKWYNELTSNEILLSTNDNRWYGCNHVKIEPFSKNTDAETLQREADALAEAYLKKPFENISNDVKFSLWTGLDHAWPDELGNENDDASNALNDRFNSIKRGLSACFYTTDLNTSLYPKNMFMMVKNMSRKKMYDWPPDQKEDSVDESEETNLKTKYWLEAHANNVLDNCISKHLNILDSRYKSMYKRVFFTVKNSNWQDEIAFETFIWNFNGNVNFEKADLIQFLTTASNRHEFMSTFRLEFPMLYVIKEYDMPSQSLFISYTKHNNIRGSVGELIESVILKINDENGKKEGRDYAFDVTYNCSKGNAMLSYQCAAKNNKAFVFNYTHGYNDCEDNLIGHTQYFCFDEFIADNQLEEVLKKSKNLVLISDSCFGGGALNNVKNNQGLPHNWSSLTYDKNPKTTENCLYYASDRAYSPSWGADSGKINFSIGIETLDILLMLNAKTWKEHYDKRKKFIEEEKQYYFSEMKNFHDKLINWLEHIPTENIQYFTNLRTKLINQKTAFIRENYSEDIYLLGKSISYLDFMNDKKHNNITKNLIDINQFYILLIDDDDINHNTLYSNWFAISKFYNLFSNCQAGKFPEYGDDTRYKINDNVYISLKLTAEDLYEKQIIKAKDKYIEKFKHFFETSIPANLKNEYGSTLIKMQLEFYLKTYIHLVASIDKNIFSNTYFNPVNFPENTRVYQQLKTYQSRISIESMYVFYECFLTNILPLDMPCAAQMSGSTKYMEQCQVGTNDLIGPE